MTSKKTYTPTELQTVFEKHLKWLHDEKGGERANLRSADLRGANLSGADLRGANLSGANLRRADLRGANLSGADLSGANLSGANLSGANLSGANLSGADLSGADLSSADLSGANLRSADLRGADLSGANLSGANLSGADLRSADLRAANLSSANLGGADLSCADLSGANLSGAKNISRASDWMAQFKSDARGVYVFKSFGLHNTPPDSWKIAVGSVITETVNPLRTCDCASGINFSTWEWQPKTADVWVLRIDWIDLADVVVPFGTDGKARCARATIVKHLGENPSVKPSELRKWMKPAAKAEVGRE